MSASASHLTSTGRIPDFEYQRVQIGRAEYQVARRGAGPPLLLLHGYPQTHYCWHKIAPTLSKVFTVVAPDLRGYGASTAPEAGPRGEGFSKREMAREIGELMSHLGFDRFAVVGHDRGARVAYRMAFDSPERVSRLVILSILPTYEHFKRMRGEGLLDHYHWVLLAKESPLPERLLSASADWFVTSTLETMCGTPGAVTPEAHAVYRAAFTPSMIAAVCADYRAGFYIDQHVDAEDRTRDHRIGCPVLVVWSEADVSIGDVGDTVENDDDNALAVWRRWAHDVDGFPVSCGHLVAEEVPDLLVPRLKEFCWP